LAATREEGTAPSRALAREASPFARFAVLAGLIAGAALIALLMFGAGGGYTVTAVFENAGQLVGGDQVRLGGRTVGRISDIGLSDSSQAEVKLEIDEELAPLHQGTTARIRSPSLSGIANRYVALDLGPTDAPRIPDGGRIGANQTSAPVDLDELFNTLDPATRRGLRSFIRGQGENYAGRGKQAAESIKYLAPALSSTSRLSREIVLDKRVFDGFIADTAALVGAVAERRTDLAQLVGNANATARAIGDENVALDRALQLLPSTLRKANTTFVNLRSTLDDLDPLVAESKPATKDLAPFLRRLQPLLEDARPTVKDLRVLIRRPGKGNDLIELSSQMPRLERLASRAFPRAIRTMNRSQAQIEYLRQYTPDLAGLFTKFGQATSTYDANGHYARVQPVFLPFRLDTAANVLQAKPRSARLEGLQRVSTRRCPGGSTQPPPDGSAPVAAPDCDPSVVPPGP
jgi:phospholipid/cholesterol/gamma-HCH transport system substrate-binding protein